MRHAGELLNAFHGVVCSSREAYKTAAANLGPEQRDEVEEMLANEDAPPVVTRLARAVVGYQRARVLNAGLDNFNNALRSLIDTWNRQAVTVGSPIPPGPSAELRDCAHVLLAASMRQEMTSSLVSAVVNFRFCDDIRAIVESRTM